MDDLTRASNVAFTVALALYVIGAVGYFHHLAFRRRFGLVTARVAAYAGAVVHAGSIVSRGVAAGRVPWGNLFEYMTVIGFLIVVAYLVIERVWHTETLGGFALAVAVVALGGAISVYVPPGPLVPALNSFWLRIHVVMAAVASALFTLGFVFSVLYLVQDRRERKARKDVPPPVREPALVAAGPGERPEDYVPAAEAEEPSAAEPHAPRSRLPAAATLDRFAYRTIVFAFPIWTLGPLVFGAIWAEQAWGRYWGWDPKEVWSFVTWVVFAGYLHARATVGWRGRRAAILAIAGFVALVFNLIVVNTVIAGLHSYAQ